ncbi:MAG: DUF2924 domain-containing protein [Phycisphaerales bacterium]|nr:DUF2924 domain-containing protein [Phycisphaerales bacterium]
MSLNMTKEVAALERMTVGELQQKYVETFGEPVRSRHRQYLIRRIAWRLQANAEGGLSERALRRAEELANLADVRVTPPRAPRSPAIRLTDMSDSRDGRRTADRRLPTVGAAITRAYRGQKVSITVLPDGFEFEGERYRSLTAVAKAITGSHINGFRFFGLEAKS